MSYFPEAMVSLNPDLEWNCEGDFPVNEIEFNNRIFIRTGKVNSMVLFEESISTTDINWGDISNEIDRLQSEFNSLRYQRDRKYPDLGEQLDMQYWDQVNGTTTWKDAVAKVKSDNPK